MRQGVTILLLLFVTDLFGQVINKNFVDNWIKNCDPDIEVDSVRAYYVDGLLVDAIDSTELNARLRMIPIKQIHGIWYSKIRIDTYVPGKGTIIVMPIREINTDHAIGWLTEAKGLFIDKYVSFSQHILTDSKDPVLVIDGQSILPSIAKETLERLNPEDIYDISVNAYFPAPSSVYGRNAKNGLVQIWTRYRYTK